MASITSVISFFILLLATYSYSAPVGNEYGTSTTGYAYPTGQTIIHPGHSHNYQLMSDQEATGAPDYHNHHSSEEYNSEESPSHSVTRSLNTFEDSSYPSSTETNDKRSVEDFLMSTIESSTEFNRRTIRPAQSEEEVETSTADFSEHQIETSTDVEPSSSVQSFGKYTGLLYDQQHSSTPEYDQQHSSTPEYDQQYSSTPEYEQPDHSSEESTTRSTGRTQKLTKTVSIIPGKITETKIYANAPGKTSVFIQPYEEQQQQQRQQLSQGSTLLLFLLAALLFCAFLMASTIAIVKSNESLKRRSRLMEMDVHLDKKQLLK